MDDYDEGLGPLDLCVPVSVEDAPDQDDTDLREPLIV